MANAILLFEKDKRVHLSVSEPGSSTKFVRLIDNARVSFPPVLFGIAAGLLRAQRIAHLSAIGDGFPVSLAKIKRHADMLHVIDGASWYDASSRTWMSVHPLGDFQLDDERPLVVLIPRLVVLGGYRVACIIAFEGTFTMAMNPERAVVTKRARSRLVGSYVLPWDSSAWLSGFRDAIDTATEPFEADGCVVLGPRVDDIVDDWLKSLSGSHMPSVPGEVGPKQLGP